MFILTLFAPAFLRPEQPLPSYPWSSLSWYSAAPEHRPRWMRVDRVLGAHGIQEDTPEGRQEFQGRIEARRQAEQAQEEDALRQIRHGWGFATQESPPDFVDQ